ncbi:hypothetical protein DYB37_004816 [Aphanomyces astaci]|uniref:HTH CENPB-type domain-containing protein n=2 Tax=Aphanomyces astaci TaxID=112090 RepID=A0A3R7AV29_APHAT|nr:hypothetical protein DYB37_004816 [Aphanomyces astaci]
MKPLKPFRQSNDAAAHAVLVTPVGTPVVSDPNPYAGVKYDLSGGDVDRSPAFDPTFDLHRKHILFISVGIRGHTTPLLRIAEDMVRRGCNVSFATHDSGKEWVQRTGARFVSAGAFPISAEVLRDKLQAITRDASNFRGILNMFNDIYIPTAQPMFDALFPVVSLDPPDLVVVDIATIGGHDLVHKLGLPYLVNSPSILFDIGGTPSYVPAWGTGFSIHMSLWNRCMNLLFPRLLSVALTPPFMQLQLTPYRSQHDMFKGSRVLVNTAVGLEYPRPLSPLVELVGPIIPLDAFNESASDAALPPLVTQWMVGDDGLHGVIYVCLGSLSYIDAWQAQAIVEGLSNPNDPAYRVLWTLPNDQRGALPQALPPTFRIKVMSSTFPHLRLLAHSSVKLVISHCGMVSAQEALVFGKPILCLPFLVDQPDVAARVVDAGAGLVLDKTHFTAEEVRQKALMLLRNASYARNAARVGAALRSAGGIERVTDIIASTLQFGTHHLTPVDLKLPWHKVVMLDVWAVYAALFCSSVVFMRIVGILIMQGFIMPSTPETAKVKARRGRAADGVGKGNLTVEQKRRICEKHRSTPKITQKDLCRWAMLEFQLSKAPTQPTMSNILKHEHLFRESVGGAAFDLSRKTIRPTKFNHFDQALANWVLERHNKVNLTGDAIKEKGRELSAQMGLEGKLAFSNGWLSSFKQRHGFKKLGMPKVSSINNNPMAMNLIDPTSAAALITPVMDFKLPDELTSVHIKELTQHYALKDIFTMDETGLFFRISPHAFADHDNLEVHFAQESKLTVALTVNADASEMLEPFIVGDVYPPKDWRSQSAEKLGFNYVHNAKSKMTVFIFQNWLRDLNARMQFAQRSILLLIDNAPSHIVVGLELSNVRLIVFPPTMGLKAQPMHCGITTAFKCRYRMKHLAHAIDRNEEGSADIYSVKQLQAMQWISEAWREVPKEVVINCWRKANFVAAYHGEPVTNVEVLEKSTEDDLWSMLYCLQLGGVINIKELLNSRGENDVHKQLNEEFFDEPREAMDEFKALDNALSVSQAVADVTGEDGVGGGHVGGEALPTLQEHLDAFRTVIRCLETSAPDPDEAQSLAEVLQFLKKKQLGLRLNRASTTTFTL